ncbi:MAG: hypothetical protein AUI04_15105 [Candidatus Rokubacteria bacterium 13_2_20CM_2_64_8]|nr:MAG: hypothetical protein AUI04_15105 [Candidatus Rokubacteria bacterium 13_2_20CM_2_64_8]
MNQRAHAVHGPEERGIRADVVESRRLLNLREGLFTLIKSVPSTLRHEPGVIVAEGDFVIVHGRFSGAGRPKSWIAADILRIVDGVLVEHWDVLQDEASQAESKSGRPMFGDSFTESCRD